LKVLVTLDLRNNGISGTLPISMDSIATLDIIQLDYNQMTGILPIVTNSLTRRQTISLSHNLFEGNIGVSADFNLSSSNEFRVQYIDLSYNKLTGPISPFLGFLPTFRYFDLSGNGFVGTFPSFIPWGSIEFLASASNFHTGTVPIGWPTLSK
jgi:Leucine-rich repeat (LRR) protein